MVNKYQCFIRPKVHFAPEFSLKAHQVLGFDMANHYWSKAVIYCKAENDIL